MDKTLFRIKLLIAFIPLLFVEMLFYSDLEYLFERFKIDFINGSFEEDK